MLESKVQLAPTKKNEIIAVLTPKSIIQLTVFTAFETGRKLNSVCCNHVHYFHQLLVLSLKKGVFPSILINNSHTMHIFIIFMRTKQDQIFDDDNFDDDNFNNYKCYLKILLRFFNNNIAREKIDKKFKGFCYVGLLKILII